MGVSLRLVWDACVGIGCAVMGISVCCYFYGELDRWWEGSARGQGVVLD